MEIDIIGAGPAGSYVAYLLALKGHKVTVYEKDAEIGKPVQCTGILSDYFEKLMMPRSDFVLNTIYRTRIYAPSGHYVEAKIKKNYVICRKKFDNFLAAMARNKGVIYRLNHSFNKFIKKGRKVQSVLIHNHKEVISEADVLIGADGPLSQVAKSAGLFKNRHFIIGTQVESRHKNDNVVEFYPHLGCYAWIVPVNKDVVRIGVSSYKDSNVLFRRFAEQELGKGFLGATLENQSGVIPVFDPFVKVQDKNIFLIGDAATFNKATSGGGINQALKAGAILTDCIHNNKDYNLEWKRHLFLELYFHLRLHKMMQKFSSKDWEHLIDLFSTPKMKKILYRESRDRLVSMLFRIAVAEPRLIQFAKYL